jgi:ATP-dependent DNA helicase RecG
VNPNAVDALDVLDRTLNFLLRDPPRSLGRARYIEDTLSPWAARLGSAVPDELEADVVAVRVALAGFDESEPDDRLERVRAMAEAVRRVRTHVGEAVPGHLAAQAVLLPAGIASDVPPDVPGVELPPAPVIDLTGDAGPAAAPAAEADGEEVQERGGGRRERARPNRDAPEPPAPIAEAPPPVVVAPPPPPPPPPPPTFPLGAPEGSGVAVSSLGLTPEETEQLAAHDVHTVADLLLLAPAALDRAGERLVDGVEPEGPVLLRGKVSHRVTRFTPTERRHQFLLHTDRGDVTCRWFGSVPVEVAGARSGSSIGLVGRYEAGEGAPVLYDAEPLGVDGRGGDWLPRYDLSGLPDRRVRALLRAALRLVDTQLADHLPAEVLEKHKLVSLPLALRDAHFPSNVQRRGRVRLAFDELFQVQLGLALLRAPERRERGTAHGVQHGNTARALAAGGWQFNDSQEAVFDTIRRDLRRSAPMERLIQGDVGSGKGAVVRAAMTVIAEEKQQVFFCAADALAAEHHHLFAAEWWRSLGIEPLLLLGPPTRAQAEALQKGETLVVYGTSALLDTPPAVRKLGLVVVEQSGTFSPPDLSKLDSGAPRPDVLVLTPTPVPALLAMTVYSQLTLSVVARPTTHRVDTQVLPPARRDEAYAAAREAIAAGRQVILVFPYRSGRTALLSPSEARRMAEALSQQQLPGARFALFSGGLTSSERFRAYDDFQHRKADVLLATTAFEEGPIVPNASVIIVEYAEGFDLVRLHRLRNHIANGWAAGRCFFVQSDDAPADAAARLELVATEDDGFRVADLDLAQRGVAAALGENVDVPRFTWADPAQDREMLTRARQEAFKLLALDPGLRRRQHRPLLNLVRMRFGEEPQNQDGPPPPPTGGEGAARRRRRRRR